MVFETLSVLEELFPVELGATDRQAHARRLLVSQAA
jgi:hypothetical protein